jgi:hypothetical protein
MTPEECNLAFEDDISITFLSSILEIVDDVINFFTFGIWGWFFSMRESYAHATLSALAGAQSYLNCYVPNSLVYSSEPSKATSQLEIDDLIEKKKFKIIMDDLVDSIYIYQNYYLGANHLYFTVYSFFLRMFFEIFFAMLTLYSIYDMADADENNQRWDSKLDVQKAAAAANTKPATPPTPDNFKPDAKN